MASPAVAALLGIKPGEIVHEPRGCTACGGSGYKGRIGVFEAVRVDDTIRRLINAGGDEVAISDHAFRSSPGLNTAVADLVRDGVTTAEEAVRISRRDGENV